MPVNPLFCPFECFIFRLGEWIVPSYSYDSDYFTYDFPIDRRSGKKVNKKSFFNSKRVYTRMSPTKHGEIVVKSVFRLYR